MENSAFDQLFGATTVPSVPNVEDQLFGNISESMNNSSAPIVTTVPSVSDQLFGHSNDLEDNSEDDLEDDFDEDSDEDLDDYSSNDHEDNSEQDDEDHDSDPRSSFEYWNNGGENDSLLDNSVFDQLFSGATSVEDQLFSSSGSSEGEESVESQLFGNDSFNEDQMGQDNVVAEAIGVAVAASLASLLSGPASNGGNTFNVNVFNIKTVNVSL